MNIVDVSRALAEGDVLLLLNGRRWLGFNKLAESAFGAFPARPLAAPGDVCGVLYGHLIKLIEKRMAEERQLGDVAEFRLSSKGREAKAAIIKSLVWQQERSAFRPTP